MSLVTVIRLADCRDALSLVGWDYVGMIIADPPYATTSLAWDRQCKGWPGLLCPREWCSLWLFGSLRSLLRDIPLLEEWKLAQDVIWEKHNGSNFHADRFRRVHEHIVQFYQGPWSAVYKQPQYTNDARKRTTRRKKRPAHTGNIGAAHYTSEDGGPRLMRSVIRCRSCHGYAIHPTEKPVELLRRLIAYSCPPGKIVLDLFAGSGAVGEAASLEGRGYLGFEIDQEYFNRARERLLALKGKE